MDEAQKLRAEKQRQLPFWVQSFGSQVAVISEAYKRKVGEDHYRRMIGRLYARNIPGNLELLIAIAHDAAIGDWEQPDKTRSECHL